MDNLAELQNIHEHLNLWLIYSLLGFLVGIVLVIYGMRKKKTTPKLIGIALFWNMIFSIFMISFSDNHFQIKAKKALLSLLSEPHVSVKICNSPINIKLQDIIISEVKLLKNIDRHHSYPNDTIPIKIVSKNGDIQVRIARDSDVDNEYWIFWDKYDKTKNNAIGFLRTNKFDNIGCK
jgi:hypothetical protein